MMFSNPFKKKEVNYEELEGAAGEAARAALKSEVSPSVATTGMNDAVHKKYSLPFNIYRVRASRSSTYQTVEFQQGEQYISKGKVL